MQRITWALFVVLLAAGCAGTERVGTGNGTPSSVGTGSTMVLTTQPVPTVDLTTLTESYGCGYGFKAANRDQTVGLSLNYDTTDQPQEVRLPSAGWTGTVNIGRNLFATYEQHTDGTWSCSDVTEFGAPRPEIDEAWTIVGGTITINPTQRSGVCGPKTVSFRAAGLVAQRPDGSTVELGDIDVLNNAFGCFAG